MIILYADLVDACRDKPKVLEMVISHGLGHIVEGHLKATWFLMPGLAFPFLGKAYSRAREFTWGRL
jgi:Zn-dependent protease with chaperone function